MLVLELVPLMCGKHFKYTLPPQKGSCLSLGCSFQNFQQAPYKGVPPLPPGVMCLIQANIRPCLLLNIYPW